MKIVQFMSVVALLAAFPALCGKDKDKDNNFKTAMAPIAVADEHGNQPASTGLEGERYKTAVSGISYKEAKPKKVKRTEEPVLEEKALNAHKEKNEIKVVTAKVGEIFTIELPASPKLGRTWEVYKKLPVGIKHVGSDFVKSEGGKYEGVMVFKFKAEKAHKNGQTIHFKKIYPKGMKKPLKVKAFEVDITK